MLEPISEHTTGKGADSAANQPASQSTASSSAKQASKRTAKAASPAKQSASKTTGKAAASQSAAGRESSPAVVSLGDYAHRVIREHYRAMVQCERGVLANDAEQLHQMRVSSRRLYTALSVFQDAIELPKAASPKRVRSLTKALGKLRDLDVQLEALQQEYLPHLDETEQRHLDAAIAKLERQRHKARVGAEDVLSQSRYKNLKLSYEAWLAQPRLTPIGTLPLAMVLPDLLSPLLARSLLHPGWLVAAADLTADTAEVLHDLRKGCKFARYQSEFFTEFYGKEFKAWVKGLKTLQDNLGSLQDIQVLHRMLAKYNLSASDTPQLHAAIASKQESLLAQWEQQRQQYLDQDFRYGLHRMLLAPAC